MSEVFTTTIREDWSVVLPDECCDALGVKPGDVLVCESDGSTLLITPLKTLGSELSES